ncbi:MAG: response regulator transcription factor [Bacteroidales bacterium]|nr:response regulator transcription factor [Bacteroidales bacterium]MBO7529606.1 response regulator transcription factor [Bacteroidales bacterium]
MKALIIEDEILAAQSLQKLVKEVSPDTEIIGILQSIEESVAWFDENPMPDLVFMDIHLADGSSFAIFDKTQITCPIIFTTAYDEYALKAFEVSSIDYLLKPINRNDLTRAMNKYNALVGEKSDNNEAIDALLRQIGMKKNYKSCFLVPERDKLVPLPTANIAYIYIEDKWVKAVTLDEYTHYISQTLDDIMNQLNPDDFFRANRQFIVSRKAIKDLTIWFGNKLSLNMSVKVPEKIIISKAKVSEFKNWFSK